MLRLTEDQLNAPRTERLRQIWRSRATHEGLAPEAAQGLEEPTVAWLVRHRIEMPENIDFVMVASARTNGAFLSAPPVKLLMAQCGGEYEVAVSALRNQTAARAASQSASRGASA